MKVLRLVLQLLRYTFGLKFTEQKYAAIRRRHTSNKLHKNPNFFANTRNITETSSKALYYLHYLHTFSNLYRLQREIYQSECSV